MPERAPARSAPISITVKPMSGKNIAVSILPSFTVAKLKEVLADKDGMQVCMHKVMFGGKELDDSRSLDESQVTEGATLFLVVKVKNAQIMVKTLKDRVFYVNVEEATTISDLKRRVVEQDPQWEVARQRMIFQGRELQDQDLLSRCGLDEANPAVHLVMRLPAPGFARRKKDPESQKQTKSKSNKEQPPAVSVKREPSDDLSGTFALAPTECRFAMDELMSCPLPMDLDTAWTQFEDSNSETPHWDVDSALQLPSPTTSTSTSDEASMNDTVVMATPVPPMAASNEPASSFADMVANAKSDREEEPQTACPSTQGRAYDLTKVDDKLRKRLLKNRLSAERSRQRKQAHVETLEFELSCCRSENEALKKRVASLEAQLTALSLSNQPGAVLRAQIAVT